MRSFAWCAAVGTIACILSFVITVALLQDRAAGETFWERSTTFASRMFSTYDLSTEAMPRNSRGMSPEEFEHHVIAIRSDLVMEGKLTSPRAVVWLVVAMSTLTAVLTAAATMLRQR